MISVICYDRQDNPLPERKATFQIQIYGSVVCMLKSYLLCHGDMTNLDHYDTCMLLLTSDISICQQDNVLRD